MNKPTASRNSTVFLNTIHRTILVAMIPLVIMSLCIFLFYFRQMMMDADDSSASILLKDEQIIDQTLDNLHRSLNYIVQDVSVVNFSMHPYIQNTERDIGLLATLKNLKESYSFVEESSLYSPHENRQLCSTGSIINTVPEWYSQMLASYHTLRNGIFIWMEEDNDAFQTFYIAAAVPMSSSEPAGYVALKIDFQKFAKDALELEKQDLDSCTYIVSDKYGLIYSTKGAANILNWMDELLEIPSGSSKLELMDATLRHCTILRSDALDWTYIYTTQAFSASALVALLLPMLVSILTAIGIGLWLAWRNSMELYRPLEKLVSEISDNLPAGVDVPDEYSRLAHYYNTLLKQRDEVYERVMEIKPLLLKRFLVSLAYSEIISPDEIQYQTGILELPFQETAFLVFFMQIDSYFKLPYTDDEKRAIRNWIIELTESGEQEHIYTLATDVSDETLLVICNLLDNTDIQPSDTLLSHMQRLKEQIEYKWEISLTLATSTVIHSVEELPSACQQAKAAISYKLYRGGGCIISYGEVCQEPRQPYSIDFEKSQMLFNALRSGNSKHTTRLLNDIFSDMKERHAEPEHIRAAMNQLVVALADVTCSSYPAARSETLSTFTSEFSKRKTMLDMEEWLITNYSCAAEQIREDAAQKPSKGAEKIRDYIDTNFVKDISLTTIAEYMGYSSTYVSKIFKQTYGISYIEYMNTKRIELSKKLLLETSLSVKEIGFQVGFNNMQTFFRIFKQYVGTTPLQYRESMGGH